MRAFWGLITSILFVWTFVFSCSQKNDNNPVGPDGNAYTISGNVVDLGNLTLLYTDNYASLYIVGEGIDDSLITESDGSYEFINLKKGNYTLTPLKQGYIFVPPSKDIAIVHDNVAVDFLCYEMDKNEYVITGKIVDTDNNPVYGIDISVHLDDSDQTIGQGTSDESGYYLAKGLSGPVTTMISKGQTYKVIPYIREFSDISDYNYSFTPEFLTVTIEDNITICNFTARYNGEPLHTITGTVLDFNGNGIVNFRVQLVIWDEGGRFGFEEYSIRNTITNSAGEYTFYGLNDGEYSVFIYSLPSEYEFENEEIEVDISGENIVLPAAYADNTYTIHSIYGKVIDDNGIGIPVITITFYRMGIVVNELIHETETDSDGIFNNTVKIKKHDKDNNYLIVPRKTGITFSPDSALVELSWIKGVHEGDDVTIPDFIGQDHTTIFASEYFPLSTNSAWTYIRTEDGDTTYDVTVTITGTVDNGEHTYYRFSEPGPWNFTGFRILDNNVYALSGDEEVLFLKFGTVPRTQWESGVIAGTYTRFGTTIGTETVATPAGTFDNCVHFESKIVYGETSYDSYNLWYAAGVGLVKSVKVVENYGRRLEYVVDELKEYEIP